MHTIEYYSHHIQIMTTYGDMVNVSSFGKRRTEFSFDRGGVLCFCKKCNKPIQALQKDTRQYQRTCPLCGGHHIAIGTVAGMREHLEDELRGINLSIESAKPQEVSI
jgi:hypothetical protein